MALRHLAELRRKLRPLVPLSLRRALARILRTRRDCAEGLGARLAQLVPGQTDWPVVVTLTQEIKRSNFWEGKLANLRLGAARIDGVRIAPGQVFSFWALVGQPTAKCGFSIGRAIRDDAATGDPGGGLCQLSGIAYELGLRGGLAVLERHPHSRDLYEHEEDRFTALGLDATVVWPWKDLRLENCGEAAIVLRFSVEGLVLRAWLQAEGQVDPAELALERIDHAEFREVWLRRDGLAISHDRYAC